MKQLRDLKDLTDRVASTLAYTHPGQPVFLSDLETKIPHNSIRGANLCVFLIREIRTRKVDH